MPYKLKDGFKLKKFQKEGVKFALQNKCVLIADEMGLGKSIQALGVSIVQKAKTLIICPSMAVNSWAKEIEKNTELNYLIFNHKNPIFDSEVVLCTYYQLPCVYSSFSHVIVDESHSLKNPKAKRTKDFLELFQKIKPENMTFLSGTPVKNKIPEIFIPLFIKGQYKNTKKSILDKYRSYYLFCNQFAKVKQLKLPRFKVNQYYGMKNVDELKGYLADFLIRRKADEVLQLPEIVEKEVEVSYQEDYFLELLFEDFCNGGGLVNSEFKAKSAEMKSPFTAEYIIDLKEEVDTPIIVFSDHVQPISTIKSMLKKFKVGVITGEVPMNKRTEILDKFSRGEIDVLLATIGAAKENLTLVESNHMVFNDLPWVPADLSQAMGRIRRIGQSKICHYHYMIGSDIDKKINRTLRDKRKIIASVLS